MASVEGIALNDDYRSPEPGAGTGGWGQFGPAHVTLTDYHSTRSENAPARGGKEGVTVFAAQLFTYAVHRVRDLVVRMARDIFVQRCGVHLAAGTLLAPDQPLGALENLVGNGYCRFHTLSITVTRRPRRSQVRSGAITRLTMAITLIRMFIEGPDVSLKGSPTVSPTTTA